MTKGPVDDLDDAADLPAFGGGKMGIDATKKWASEGYTRPGPRVVTTEAAGRRAAAIVAKLRMSGPV
jgi:4-hydroxy-3-polyprenylbenzoate decarboxylase